MSGYQNKKVHYIEIWNSHRFNSVAVFLYPPPTRVKQKNIPKIRDVFSWVPRGNRTLADGTTTRCSTIKL